MSVKGQSACGSALSASCTRCSAGCRWSRCSRKGDSSASCGPRRSATTRLWATRTASGAPQQAAMRCSARSMPQVTPALVHSGPSCTNTRLCSTSQAGSAACSSPRCWWCVVARCPASRPARAAISAPAHTHSSSQAPSFRRRPRSQCSVARASALSSTSASPGWPTSTTQLGAGRAVGKGSSPAISAPTDDVACGCAPMKRRRKRAAWPSAFSWALADRNASAGPAQSSSRLPGSSTNSTSMAAVVAPMAAGTPAARAATAARRVMPAPAGPGPRCARRQSARPAR